MSHTKDPTLGKAPPPGSGRDRATFGEAAYVGSRYLSLQVNADKMEVPLVDEEEWEK